MSDFILPGPPDDKRETITVPPPPPNSTGLPPEVEAELRARLGPSAWQNVAPSDSGSVVTSPSKPSFLDRLKSLGPLGASLALLLTKLKTLAFLLPILKTGGSMLVYAWYMAWRGGWPFAIGFVGSIFVHEMGHVIAAWRYGYPITTPLFIPGMGAVIFHRSRLRSAWEGAVQGIAGPVAGTLAGLGFLAAYYLTGNQLMSELAFFTFAINLFNLAPFFPLDGGWVTGCISPRIWIIGVGALVAMFVTGVIRNPFILLLAVLSLPRIWHGIRTGDSVHVGEEPATPQQKLIMGVSYISLCGLLFWLMAHTHVPQ